MQHVIALLADAQGAADTAQPLQDLDPHRLSQRQRQIDFGKNTAGYTAYTAKVPKCAPRLLQCSCQRIQNLSDTAVDTAQDLFVQVSPQAALAEPPLHTRYQCASEQALLRRSGNSPESQAGARWPQLCAGTCSSMLPRALSLSSSVHVS